MRFVLGFVIGVDVWRALLAASLLLLWLLVCLLVVVFVLCLVSV